MPRHRRSVSSCARATCPSPYCQGMDDLARAHTETAATRLRDRDCAKGGRLRVDGRPIETIASHRMTGMSVGLLALARGRELRLPKDEEVERLFPKRDRETMASFSPLYLQPVFVDLALVVAPEIVFKAGDDSETICAAGRILQRVSGRSSASSLSLRFCGRATGCRPVSRCSQALTIIPSVHRRRDFLHLTAPSAPGGV